MGNGTVALESFRLPLENGLYLEGEVRVPSGPGGDGDYFGVESESWADGDYIGESYSRDKSEGNSEGKSKGRLPVIILSHGFRGHKDWAFWPDVAGRLSESGFYTVSFNFSRIAARRLLETPGAAGIAGATETAETSGTAEASTTAGTGGVVGNAGSGVFTETVGITKHAGTTRAVVAAETGGIADITGVAEENGTAGTDGIAGLSAERLAAEAATLTRELQDLELVLGSLKEGRLPLAGLADTSRIGLLGHSRAGGGNIIFAAEHPEVNALVVWNGGYPPARTTQDSAAEPTLLEQILERDQELNRERFNIEQALERVTAPALIIQGARDRASLLEQNARFREQAPQHRYAGVSGADHTFNTTHPYEGPTPELKEALALTLEFLQEKLG